MSKPANGRKPLLSAKLNQLENSNRMIHLNEQRALTYALFVAGFLFVFMRRWGPDQVWYMDKMISVKLAIYNLFAKEKIEVLEDFKYEELKLEDRPREKPYVRTRDGTIEMESY